MNTEIDVVSTKGFQPSRSSSVWLGSRLVRFRWWLFAFLCLAVGIFEFFVAPLFLSDPKAFELEQLAVFFIVLLATWSLAEILYRAVVARSQAVELLEIKHDLNVRLALAPDWKSLTEMILGFCAAQVVLEGAALLLKDSASGNFEVVARSESEDDSVRRHEAALPPGGCVDDLAGKLYELSFPPETAEELPFHGYCLPLTLGERVIAKLNLYLPARKSLNERQTEIFNSCSADLATALGAAQLSQANAELLIEQAGSAQRRRFARDLHDTLGQKLVYLRLKLDQYANSNGAIRLSDIHKDLVQMQLVANESYELVRGTLAVLDNDEAPALLRLLMGHSRLAIERTRLKFTFEELGQPQTLPFETMQQIFYMFGEALSNIERHAAANKVDVKLIWSETELTIRVSDDGRGFDTAVGPAEGHYGLRFMRERAEAVGADIDLHSAPGGGTCLTIQLPVGDN